jgi:hypothetical protein
MDRIRRLAADSNRCQFYAPVLSELRNHGLDDEDLREIIISELGDKHCFASKPTKKYYPDTISDYFSLWIDDCGCHMFIKLLIANVGQPTERLVVTSFKRDKDKNYDS